MHRVSGWIKLHLIWVIILSLTVALLLGSGVWFFIRTSASSVNDVLVTGPAFVALFDKDTGKQIWRYQTDLYSHQISRNTYRTGITAFAPLVSNGLVYILTQTPVGYTPNGFTYTLEALSLANGTVQWSWGWKEASTLGDPLTLANGVIYISAYTFTGNIDSPPSSPSSPGSPSAYQGFVVALGASDGHQLWKVSLAGQLSLATVADHVLYLSNGKALLALSASDGHQLWQYQPDDGDMAYYNQIDYQTGQTHTIIVQGQVYLEIRRVEGIHAVDDLVALNPRTGRLVWRYWSHGESMTMPILANNTLYVGIGWGAVNTPFVALNANTGVASWTYQGAPGYASQPVLDNGVLYLKEFTLPGVSGDVVALQASNGHVLKRYTPASGEVFSTFTVNQQTLYLTVSRSKRTPGEVIALNRATGAEVWHSSPSPLPVGLSVTVSQNQAYAVVTQILGPSTLFVLQAGSGKQLWSYGTSDPMYPVVTAV
ncbi:PQQ-binding-like beta-propeller repeat protein [Ktedonobacter racemifer]|uniref:Pyrrolo-quinoline quinone n=1 Tax=Ktedonobacter racemifer DSM 44963 TaxID=485913 RepID=D6TY50_KTERA|nr:PQQ-binding-like beta-propeller repeat protein [Ktedonobacter racemifer]EFH85046.1 Pyrrolo-quinoline quinone [Ktedonobacter racemifer DSM 44963]